mmetsp:Transcript_45193/g.72774  ORF Transcript_45193/g.72774 Transcript_45193/m.72774 type:complete len:193 (+) Transcript_45193:72-650(+)
MGETNEWSLRNTGLYIFGTQIIVASCMFIMICTYIIMGFVGKTGDDDNSVGPFPYPKTAFLPFGSTIWTLFCLATLTVVDFVIAILAFNSTTSATKSGLGSYVAAKTCLLMLYLCIFGLSTEWMGSEVAVAILYIAFSLTSACVALMLFNALSMGGHTAAEAGFQEGCQDEDEERRPLTQQVRPVQYQSQYV